MHVGTHTHMSVFVSLQVCLCLCKDTHTHTLTHTHTRQVYSWCRLAAGANGRPRQVEKKEMTIMRAPVITFIYMFVCMYVCMYRECSCKKQVDCLLETYFVCGISRSKKHSCASCSLPQVLTYTSTRYHIHMYVRM